MVMHERIYVRPTSIYVVNHNTYIVTSEDIFYLKTHIYVVLQSTERIYVYFCRACIRKKTTYTCLAEARRICGNLEHIYV